MSEPLWTSDALQGDGVRIYVSAQSGDDANTGLDSAHPVKTLAYALTLLRNGHADQLLLKCGDTWTGETMHFTSGGPSGASGSAPIVVGWYGAGARPKLVDCLIWTNFAATINYILVTGIELEAVDLTNPDVGTRILHNGTNFFFEDCKFTKVATGAAPAGGVITNFRFIGCIGVDQYTNGSGSAGWFYIENIAGLTIEKCVADHCGWRDTAQGAPPIVTGCSVDAASSQFRRTSGSFIDDGYGDGVQNLRNAGFSNDNGGLGNNGWFQIVSVTALAITVNPGTHTLFDEAAGGTVRPASIATVFNRNLYLQASCTDIVVRSNISARSSSDGIQQRNGGLCEKNLFLQNPIGIGWGHTENPVTAGGTIRWNAILDGASPENSLGYGIGMWWTKTSGTDCYENIIAHQVNGGSNIGILFGETNANFDIHDNIINDWSAADDASGFSFTGTFSGTNYIRNNDVQATRNSLSQNAGGVDISSISFQTNRWYSAGTSSGNFIYGGAGKTFAQWVTATGDTSAFGEITYSNPNRNIKTYMESIGEAPATLAEALTMFLNGARAQRRGAWDTRYESLPVINHLRAGYGLAPVSGDQTWCQLVVSNGVMNLVTVTV